MKRVSPTKIFLDGGDPAETAAATALLLEQGFRGLDGQTTNPSLVAKNPAIAARISRGEKLSEKELLRAYRDIVISIADSTEGDISVEVYADTDTPVADIVAQAQEFASWTPQAVIKLPIIQAGLAAAEQLKDSVRLNMTLCFSQEQAAAVYAATQGSAHPVYVSPFIGRLDDSGVNGLSLIENLQRMYSGGDGHVEILIASVRSVEHVQAALALQPEVITIPFEKAFKPWAEEKFALPPSTSMPEQEGLLLPYEDVSLEEDWQSYAIDHELTRIGLQKFVDDWNSLLQ